MMLPESSEFLPTPKPNNLDYLYPKTTGNIKDLLDEINKHRAQDETLIPLIGTIKLHGTHADILIHDNDTITLQSRNRTNLTPAMDNHDFAKFATSIPDRILQLKKRIFKRFSEIYPGSTMDQQIPMTIACEWIGGNIQKRVAIKDLTKRLVVIGVCVNGQWMANQDIADIEDEDVGIYNISRGGFYYQNLNLEAIDQSLVEIKELTLKIEKECPFAKSFGISGMGEGLVFKISPAFHNACSGGPSTWWKSKGDQHAVTNADKLPLDTAALERKQRATLFAQAVVTDARCEQGWDYLEEMGTKRDMKGLGMFLKWLVADCTKEEQRKLKELNIAGGLSNGAISLIGREWYKKKMVDEL